MNTSLKLEIVNGHLLVEQEGRVDLLDTGCPFTLDAPETISAGVGCRVDRIVGNDQLGQGITIFDLGRRVVHFGAEPPENVFWIPAPLKLGIPQVRIQTPFGEAMAICDTGAWIGYGPKDTLSALQAVRQTHDFSPLLGTFETPVYQVILGLAGREVQVDVGVLPPSFSGLMTMAQAEWIVGPALFAGRRLVLDLANQRIADLPAEEPMH